MFVNVNVSHIVCGVLYQCTDSSLVTYHNTNNIIDIQTSSTSTKWNE